MGCDIHLHTEIKVGGKWLHYGAPNMNRNYALFEKMAGVRGEVENAIAAPRGVPGDISDVTKIDYEHWDGDGHSHSWLSAKELAELSEWYHAECKKMGLHPDYIESEMGYLFGDGWNDPHEHATLYPKVIKDVRAVFWFDN